MPALESRRVRTQPFIVTGASFGASAQWLKILIAFDVIFLTSGYLLFEHVIGED